MSSKLLLQIVMSILGLIPLVTGLPGAVRGLPSAFSADPSFPRLDSQYRYAATVWCAMGVGVYLMIPAIETHTLMFRVLMLGIFAGGFARLLSIRKYRYPIQAWLVVPLVTELVFAPLLVLWQGSLASGSP